MPSAQESLRVRPDEETKYAKSIYHLNNESIPESIIVLTAPTAAVPNKQAFVGSSRAEGWVMSQGLEPQRKQRKKKSNFINRK